MIVPSSPESKIMGWVEKFYDSKQIIYSQGNFTFNIHAVWTFLFSNIHPKYNVGEF